MDAVAIYLGLLATIVWVGCGLVAYHSFLGDMYAIIFDAAGSDDRARVHFEHWKKTRKIALVYVYFLLTGPVSLLILLIATGGFKTGFKR